MSAAVTLLALLGHPARYTAVALILVMLAGLVIAGRPRTRNAPRPESRDARRSATDRNERE